MAKAMISAAKLYRVAWVDLWTYLINALEVTRPLRTSHRGCRGCRDKQSRCSFTMIVQRIVMAPFCSAPAEPFGAGAHRQAPHGDIPEEGSGQGLLQAHRGRGVHEVRRVTR